MALFKKESFKMKWHKWPEEKPVIKEYYKDEFLVKFKEDKGAHNYLVLTYCPDHLESWPDGVWHLGMDYFGYAEDIESWAYLEELEKE